MIKLFKRKREEKEEKEGEVEKTDVITLPKKIEISPIITDKTRSLLKHNIYTFKVDPKLNKTEIKNFIEKYFNVKVEDVRTANYKKRERGRTRIKSVRRRFKKAYVKLKEGYRIPIFE
ncbi:MAG: 50S ribosomal protein L23 [Minisyncoccia bacterium]